MKILNYFTINIFFILLALISANPIHRLDSTSCTTCNLIVEIAHDLLGDDTLDDCIVDFVTFICESLRIEDHFVCKGMVGEFKEVFIYVVQELVVEPKEICGLLFKECDGGFDPYNATWILPMPGVKPSVKGYQDIPEGKPTMKVLQLSDLHIDNDYIVGSEVQCGEPLCCRPPKDSSEAKDIKQPAGKWGTVGDCDAPYWLFTDMLQNIANNHKDIDYILVSGDLESHADWDYSKEGHMEKVKNITETIKKYLPNIPTYFAVGNHEGVPIDTFAPHFTPSKFHLDFLYETMYNEWKDWVPSDQQNIIQHNGCYMKQLFPGLRLISLNNGLGDAVNFFLYINQTDPDGTMTWFLEQLEDAERNNQKVQIVAHIPGGGGEALEGWALNYYNAVNRYEDTIVGQFFGHTHTEQFYVTYENPNNPRSRPTGVIYSAPSMTPYSNSNPAYRIYTIDGNYDGSTFEVIDFEEHFLNLTEANKNPDQPTNWEQLYSSVRTEYGIENMSPKEWNNLINNMITDDATFNKYIKNKYRRSDMDCDKTCRMNTLCDARQAHHSDSLCDDLITNKFDRKYQKPLYQRGTIETTSLNFNTKDEALSYINSIKKTLKLADNDKCKI